MNRYRFRIFVLSAISVLIAACGGGGSDGGGSGGDGAGASLSFRCPAWNLGDSMSYQRTEIANGVETTSTVTTVVTQRRDDLVSVSDGITARTYRVTADGYIPESEHYTSANQPGATFTSSTTFCPPPSVGSQYLAQRVFIDSEFGISINVEYGELVTDSYQQTLSTAVGDLAVQTIVLDVINSDGVLTRHYANGIGVIRQEEIQDSTSLTDELTAYDYDSPGVGTSANPLYVPAPDDYATTGFSQYLARIGTNSLYLIMSGLERDNQHFLSLTGLDEDLDLQVFSDARFQTSVCRSTNTGTTDENCTATATAGGELYVKIDGSKAVEGSYFILKAGT